MMDDPKAYAIYLAREAGSMLLEYYYSRNFKASEKPDHTIVTEADLIVDNYLSRSIRSRYPKDWLLSEELQPVLEVISRSDKNSEIPAVWVVDPLDGTTNFALGLPYWGVLIARLINGMPELAVSYFPVLEELYIAQKGEGATMNGHRIQVCSPNPKNTLPVFACCSRTFREYDVRIPYKTRTFGSSAYSFSLVARGLAILGMEVTPKIWDISGAWLLVQEAGGTLNTLDGSNPFPLQLTAAHSSRPYPILAAATEDMWARWRPKIKPRSQ